MNALRLWQAGGVLAVVVILGGCVLSLEPVVPESGSTFDPRLLGAWEEVDGSDRAVVTRAGDNGYAIEYTSDGEVGEFEARLGQLGGRSVLEVRPKPGAWELHDLYDAFLVAGHWLSALDIAENEVRMAALEPETLLAAFDAGAGRLAHRRVGERVILLGKTDELRSALGPYLARSGALAEPAVWRRVPDDVAPPPPPVGLR